MITIPNIQLSLFEDIRNKRLPNRFPLILNQSRSLTIDELCKTFTSHSQELQQELAQTGSLLLRGLPINTVQEKIKVLESLGVKLESEYPFGISPRTVVEKEVFKSTDIPPPFPLAAHTEMAYLPFRPGIIAFYCAIEPKIYGETPLFDMRRVYCQLKEETKQFLSQQKLKYRHCYPKSRTFISRSIGLTWPHIFHTFDKDEVTAKLEEYGFNYSWGKHDFLEYETVVPAIIKHPVTKYECLNLLLIHPYITKKAFEQIKTRQNTIYHYLILYSTLLFGTLGRPATSISMANNSEIPYEIIKEIGDLTWSNSYYFPWKQNDLLIVDNISIAHGRMNVQGPRKITVSLGNMYYVSGDREFQQEH